jgi:hypothetical protein
VPNIGILRNNQGRNINESNATTAAFALQPTQLALNSIGATLKNS